MCAQTHPLTFIQQIFFKHFYITGTVFGATDTAMNKTKPLPSWNLYSSGGKQISKKIHRMPHGRKCYGGGKKQDGMIRGTG